MKKRSKSKSQAMSVKPNGKQVGTIVISIDDGWVEYAYDIVLSPSLSIAAIMQRIRKALKSKSVSVTGTLRTRHYGIAEAI